MAQITQIVAIATRQQSQPSPPPREVIEEPERSIERVQKLGAKPYVAAGRGGHGRGNGSALGMGPRSIPPYLKSFVNFQSKQV